MSQRRREEFITRVYKTFRVEKPPLNIIYDNDYADARSLDGFLQGKLWTEIPLKDLIRYKSDLSLLSQEGFRYYFPAFLIVVLKEPHKADLLVDNLISELIARPYNKSENRYANEQSLFTSEEQSIVRDFLALYFDLFDEEYWHHDNEQVLLLDNALKHWSSLD